MGESAMQWVLHSIRDMNSTSEHLKTSTVSTHFVQQNLRRCSGPLIEKLADAGRVLAAWNGFLSWSVGSRFEVRRRQNRNSGERDGDTDPSKFSGKKRNNPMAFRHCQKHLQFAPRKCPEKSDHRHPNQSCCCIQFFSARRSLRGQQRAGSLSHAPWLIIPFMEGPA